MNEITQAQFHYIAIHYENLNYHHLCFFLNNRQKIDVTVNVYDLLGARINTLVDNNLNEGIYKMQWNGNDMHGNSVASGIYFITVKFNETVITNKVTLLRWKN